MPLDYSHILGPAPQTGAARGQKFFGDALDAVLQRRQEMEARKMQLAAQAEESRLQRDLTGGYYRQLGEQADRARGEVERHNLKAEGLAAQQAAGERAVQYSTTRKNMAEAVSKGHATGEIARRTMSAFDPPPAAGSRPPVAGPMATPLDARPPMPPVMGPPLPAPPVTPGATNVTPLAAAGMEPGPLRPIDPAFTGATPLSAAPAQQAPSAGPIADPAAASAQMARPEQQASPDEWDALDPVKRIEAFMEEAKTMQLPARVREVLPELRAGVKGGFIPPDKAMDYINDVRDRMSHELSASLGGARAAERGDRTANHQERTAARADLSAYLDHENYRAEKMSMRQYERMTTMADLALKKTNSLAAATFMGMFVKFAQGEVGVLTPSDIDTFWTKAGSPADRTEAGLLKVLNGGVGTPQAIQARAAVKELLSLGQGRISDIYQRAIPIMEEYGPHGDRWLRSSFGRGLPAFEAARKSGLSDTERAKFATPPEGAAPTKASGRSAPQSPRGRP